MYLVRTVWELIRLNSDIGRLARIQVETFRVLAVFLDGLEMIEMGLDKKVA